MFGLTTFRRWRDQRHRAIFKFWDGRDYLYIDPMAAYRKLTTHKTFDWSTTTIGVDNNDPGATELTVKTVQEVFGVSAFNPVDRTGLTEAEAINLLLEFTTWCVRLKKNISPIQTWQETTESESLAPTDENMNASSDSGSTLDEPKPAEPTPS